MDKLFTTIGVTTLLLLQGCQTERKLVSFTPMECEHLVSGYKWRLTNKENVEPYNEGIKVKNEIDGKYLFLNQGDESSYACEVLGEGD